MCSDPPAGTVRGGGLQSNCRAERLGFLLGSFTCQTCYHDSFLALKLSKESLCFRDLQERNWGCKDAVVVRLQITELRYSSR